MTTEEEVKEVVSSNENENQEEVQIFDSVAFTGEDKEEEIPLVDEPNQEEEKQAEEHSESESEESPSNANVEDDEMDWSMFAESEEQEQKEEVVESESNAEESQSDTVEAKEEAPEAQAPDTSYEDFSEDLGFEVKSKDDIVKQFKALQQENQELKRSGTSYLNDKAKTYQKMIKMDDRTLYEIKLKGQGLSAEKAASYADKAENDGTLAREADIFRAKIDKAIDVEISKEERAQSEAIEQQEANDKENRKVVRDYINSQEEMFGMKMAKDPDKLKATRKDLQSYILDGKFMKEISSSPENLSQVAWLWKHKDVIMKGFKNRGISQGKAEFLKELNNPSSISENSSRREPTKPGEFNAGAWIAD